MNRISAVFMALLAGAMTLFLTACVTTETGGFTDAASPDMALERRVELARNYIGEGNWNDAKRNLKLAADIDPDNPEVHEAYALVYQSTGEFELAEEHFERAISLDREFSRARNNYAAFLFSQSRYEEAEKQLEFVVQDTLYEARPQSFVNLGLCRLQLFDPAGAEQAFVRALSMDRGNVIALLETAILRFDAADYESATRYYNGYRRSVRQQSARALWLGVRLSRETGDRDAESSYGMALSNRYPKSAEYEAYQRGKGND
ncbi:MAG: type IV pilus biogenesis/stability protein PilW [Halioglobus sp.]